MSSPIVRINLASTANFQAPTPRTTKDDKKVNAALAIRNIAELLQTLESPLKEAIDILSNPLNPCSEARKARAARNLKESSKKAIDCSTQLPQN